MTTDKLTRGKLNTEVVAEGYKICYVCKCEKLITEFGRHSGRSDGCQTYCKQCAKEQQTKWYYQRKHGISLEEREAMLVSQGGKCAICGNPTVFPTLKGRENNTGESAVVDHCHASSKIRGVLCGHCNTGLGSFKDNLQSLLNAVDYLLKADEN